MQKYYKYVNSIKFQSSKTVWFTMKYVLNMHNVKDILPGTYFFPNPIKTEN